MKRCKRDGESIRNQDVGNEDRISELPEALISEILSLLPTKVAIATSVLSKQWQSHWRMLPKLMFDSYGYYYHSHEPGTFSKNVRKALLSHKAPVLQSLHLSISLNRLNEKQVRKLTGIAFARNLRKLVLDVQIQLEPLRFPKCLYNCETLETLELKYSIFMDVPSSYCLKSLRTLQLHDVDFKDNESVVNLFAGCPNLENLVVYRYSLSRVKTFTIAVPSLQRLSIYNYTDRPSGDYVINAPSLNYLKMKGFKALESCLIENAPELVKATIFIYDANILGSLSSLKHLSLELSALESTIPTGIIFYQLVYLEMPTYRVNWWNLLTLMLNTSPNLQVLKLVGSQQQPLGSWNQPKNVPECLLLHLETFMYEDYYSQENGKEVTKYILKNAIYLKKATFSFNKRLEAKQKVKMVEELESVKKASNSCQLVFRWNFIY
ncbi:PREDICTED: putative F-box/FBD/LRR-repeat protein At4g13965 [Camelina sativa]|uniref:F-box/FBD/LRR-repeat protein At4g13965 n=1 Tax=Camelina sativa TaxID=90675 RepID=A0ABM1QFC4_CAMSA|nr:PREDICTED: putative F-box/FBD/LRR-repeat protein At4g13965 [Camelina sativa]